MINKYKIVLSIFGCFFLIKSFAQMKGMDMMTTTKPMKPLAVSSNESTAIQLASAVSEGDSVKKCMSWIFSQLPGSSGMLRAGEYNIAYALSAPEGWYEFNNNNVTWKTPSIANAHLWLYVLDGADGRVVPPLNIKVTLSDVTNNQIWSKQLPFALMPLVNGYGDNVDFPAPGKYKVVVEIQPPTYRRHDPYNGDRFTEATTAIIPMTIDDLSKFPILSEGMEQQSDLSSGAGKGYKNTMDVMFKQANDGRDTTTGDYRVAYALEYSEGYWYSKKSKFVYKMDNELSAVDNAHLEIVARDNLTGRFLHDLNVTATLYDKASRKIGTKAEMFMWHPWLYHYGENWRVPKAGAYGLHVHIDPPPYRRYGKNFGKLLTKPVDLDFAGIQIKTGQK